MANNWGADDRIHIQAHPTLAQLCDMVFTASDEQLSTVVIDIPVGLPNGEMRRLVDHQRWDALKDRGAGCCPFYAPPIESIDVTTQEEFETVYFEVTHGRQPNSSIWRIVPKITELREYLHTPYQLHQQFFEFDPELTWHRLLGEHQGRRTTAAGILDRFYYLEKAAPCWKERLPDVVCSHGPEVLIQVVNAVIGLSVAQDISNGVANRLPPFTEPTDSTGLPMVVWY